MRDGSLVLLAALAACGCGQSKEGTPDTSLGAMGGGGGNAGTLSASGGAVLVGGGPQGGASGAGGGAAGASAGGAAANATGGSASGAGGSASGSAGSASGAAGSSGDPYAPTFSMGMCRPKGPLLDDVPGMRVIRTAEGIDDVNGVALRGNALYYHLTREGSFRLSPPTASATEAELVNEALGTTWALIATDDYLYTIHQNTRELWRTPLATLPGTQELVMEDVSESGLLWDETNLYFSASSGTGTFVLPFAEAVPGATPRQLVERRTTYQKAVWDGFLYYIDGQAIARVPLSGGEPEAIFSAGAPRGLTIADGVIYLASDDRLLKRPVDAEGPMLTGIALGNPTFEGGQATNELSNLVVEGDRVYYREETGTLAWVKTDGSDCRIVAKHDGASFENRTWVMTSTHYYLIIDDVELVEIPREP